METHHGFRVIPLDGWNAFRDFVHSQEERFNNWVFRGHQNSGWDLRTRLERAAYERFAIAPELLPDLERGMLRRFQREAHIHSSQLPPDMLDSVAWLAVIQHYGGATRLLDWTYSPFTAAFFAVESVIPMSTCAVWALDQDWLWLKAKEKMDELQVNKLLDDPNFMKQTSTHAVLWDRRHVRPMVVPVNPFRLNDRLAAQQGVFLAPADITKTFAANLEATFDAASASDHALKLEVLLSKTELSRATAYLHRHNLGRASLFRGLGGLAQQLEQLLVIPRALETDPGSN